MGGFGKFVLVAAMIFASSLAQAECKDCTTLDFNKKIQLGLILPMLKMTLEEKAKYMQSQGVELYRVADVQERPITLGFLSYPPAGKFAAKHIKMFSEGTLGIYMTPTNLMYGVTQPTILLLESTDDWTLVHEFSHFLFDKARLMYDSTRESALMNQSTDAKEDYSNARESYKMFDAYRDEDHKQHTIDSFIVYANTQMIFAKTCEFEESTIEKMIRALYVQEQPHGFKEPHFERSTRYIRETSTNGQINLGFLSSDCEILNETLTEQDGKLRLALAKTCAKVEKMKQEDLQLLKNLGLELNPIE